MATVTFEEPSKLKRIGECTFAESGLTSISIPASTEEIDGSAFVGCQITAIRIGTGNQKFILERDLLLTLDGTEIARYFGRDLEVIVLKKVEILRKSCFEASNHAERILFENGSKLLIIGRSALTPCSSLLSILIPASVQKIEEAALKGCNGLESCLIAEKVNLVTIEKEAFSECFSLRSFCVPLSVAGIREKCFDKCVSLHRLRFVSGQSLKSLIGDLMLDEALERFGLYEIWSLFQIEIEDGGVRCELRGWSPVADGSSHLVLSQDIP
jgi:hypothetical protein